MCVCGGGGGVYPARRMYARRRSRVLYRESTRDSSTCSGGGGGCKAREHTRARLADTTIYRAQAFAGLTGNHWLYACWLRSSAGPVREDEWSACARAMGHRHVRARVPGASHREGAAATRTGVARGAASAAGHLGREARLAAVWRGSKTRVPPSVHAGSLAAARRDPAIVHLERARMSSDSARTPKAANGRPAGDGPKLESGVTCGRQRPSACAPVGRF